MNINNYFYFFLYFFLTANCASIAFCAHWPTINHQHQFPKLFLEQLIGKIRLLVLHITHTYSYITQYSYSTTYHAYIQRTPAATVNNNNKCKWYQIVTITWPNLAIIILPVMCLFTKYIIDYWITSVPVDIVQFFYYYKLSNSTVLYI